MSRTSKIQAHLDFKSEVITTDAHLGRSRFTVEQLVNGTYGIMLRQIDGKSSSIEVLGVLANVLNSPKFKDFFREASHAMLKGTLAAARQEAEELAKDI